MACLAQATKVDLMKKIPIALFALFLVGCPAPVGEVDEGYPCLSDDDCASHMRCGKVGGDAHLCVALGEKEPLDVDPLLEVPDLGTPDPDEGQPDPDPEPENEPDPNIPPEGETEPPAPCVHLAGAFLENQSEVDGFLQGEMGCVIVDGDVVIAHGVQSLMPLRGLGDDAHLVEVLGDLVIRNTQDLETLFGLGGLTKIGGQLKIEDNASLSTLEGLAHTLLLGDDLSVARNPQLSSLQGLPDDIQMTGIGADVYIRHNNGLISLVGLHGLITVPGDFKIENNASLPNLDGLQNLQRVGSELVGQFKIAGNGSMSRTWGASSLVEAHDLRIENNDALVELDGFNALSVVHDEVRIRDNRNLPQCEVDVLLASIQYDQVLIEDTVGPSAEYFVPAQNPIVGTGNDDDGSLTGAVYVCPDEAPLGYVQAD
jgi:hypothetical protein